MPGASAAQLDAAFASARHGGGGSDLGAGSAAAAAAARSGAGASCGAHAAPDEEEATVSEAQWVAWGLRELDFHLASPAASAAPAGARYSGPRAGGGVLVAGPSLGAELRQQLRVNLEVSAPALLFAWPLERRPGRCLPHPPLECMAALLLPLRTC